MLVREACGMLVLLIVTSALAMGAIALVLYMLQLVAEG